MSRSRPDDTEVRFVGLELRVDRLEEDVKSARKEAEKWLTITEWQPYRDIIKGMVGAILLAFVYGLLKLLNGGGP